MVVGNYTRCGMGQKSTLRLFLLPGALSGALIMSACVRMLPTQPSKAQTDAMQKREAVYQETLQSYLVVLKPGMNRKEVEEYLRGKKIVFRQWGGSIQHPALADVVLIRKDWKPWYCSEHNVYIVFHFAAIEAQSHSWLEAHDSDTLREIVIEHRYEGCL